MYDIERNFVVALAAQQGWSKQCEEIDAWGGKSLLCKLCQKTCTQGHALSRKHQNAVDWWKHYAPFTDYLRASTPATTPWAAAAPAPHHQPGSATTPTPPPAAAAAAAPTPPPAPTPLPAAAAAAAPAGFSSYRGTVGGHHLGQGAGPLGWPPAGGAAPAMPSPVTPPGLQAHQLGPGFAQSPLSPTRTPWAAAAPAPHHQLGAQLFFNPAAGVYFGPVGGSQFSSSPHQHQSAGVYFGPQQHQHHILRIPVQYPTHPRAPPKALPPPPPPRGGSCGDWTTAPVMIPHGLSPTQLQIQDGISIDLIGLYDSAPPPPPVGAWPPPPPADWVVVESVGTWPTPEEGGDS